MGCLTTARSGCMALLLASASVAGSAQDAGEAAALVRQLGRFPAEIDGRIQGSTGLPTPAEQRREAIYVKLRRLDGRAIPALQRGLADRDVRVRRNVTLYLSAEGGNYAKHAAAGLDVTPFLPQLRVALRDDDGMVVARAAQALAHAGSKAAIAVADLRRLLGDRRAGVRIGACTALAGIGPDAPSALPALRRALDDPHKDVRSFARRAIDRIDRAKP